MTRSWEDAAEKAAIEISARGLTYLGDEPVDELIAEVRAAVTALSDLHYRGDLGINQRTVWILLASAAAEGHKRVSESGRRITEAAIANALAEKQADYGHRNILDFGLKGIVVRVSDKAARLENLYAKRGGKNAVKGEVLADTWFDLLGYSTIALMVMDESFRSPLARDIKKLNIVVPDVQGRDQ